MKHPDCVTVSARLKRPGLRSVVLVLLLELVLSLTGQSARAGEPIADVDVKLGKNPGGAIVSAPTGSNGTFDFKDLTPGSYNLSIGGKFVQTLTVGSSRSVSGQLSKEPDDSASVSLRGLSAPIPLGPVSALNLTKQNLFGNGGRGGAGGAAAAEVVIGMAVARPAEFVVDSIKVPTPQTGGTRLPGTAGSANEAPQKAGLNLTENTSPGPTTRGVRVAAGDVNGDGATPAETCCISIEHHDGVNAGGLPDARTASNFRIEGQIGRAEDVKADASSTPGNPSPNGLVKTGCGQLTLSSASVGTIDPASRDHLDEDALAAIKTPTGANPSTGPNQQVLDRGGLTDGLLIIRRSEALPGGTSASPTPIPQKIELLVVIALRGGPAISIPTGPDGTFELKGLAPGKYELSVGGKSFNTLAVEPDGLASGRVLKSADGTLSIFDRWGNSIKIAENTSPIPRDRVDLNVAVGDLNGDGKADARTAPGNPSTNGLVKTGTGQLTLSGAGFVNVDSSNRDHIDQDAQADIKKSTSANPSTGPNQQALSTTGQKSQDDPGAKPDQAGLRIAADVSTLRVQNEKEPDKGPDKSTLSDRFGNRGISSFGSGAGPGGMTPPISGPMAGPGPMGPGPMGPGPMGMGAMGAGAGRK